MPISSLPTPYGIGTLGKEAYDFVDFLEKSHMKIWQILPLLPTNYGDSPYQSCSANALNFYFIDFTMLKDEGLLKEEDYACVDWKFDDRRVHYGKLFEEKARILKIAFDNYNKESEEFVSFLKEGVYEDFAIFMTLKTMFSHKAWKEWGEYAVYDEEKINQLKKDRADDIAFWQFTQFLFLKQWDKLKAYTKKKGIEIMGDMPLYVAFDSVEAWKYGKDLFLFDEDQNPVVVAGVPPDAFSADGQLWGNPIYNWEKMKAENYAWWKDRINYAFRFFDILRIDHFRGFDEYYVIPFGAKTAMVGEWREGPKAKLFEDFKDAKIVAEDLGIIGESVRRLLKATGYPGMRVLEFAFDGNAENSHKPSLYVENTVAYTGTHDNMPLCQYLKDMKKEERKTFEKELKEECKLAGVKGKYETIEELCNTTTELMFASKANTVIASMSDLLCKYGEARINAPSTVSSANWTYRYLKEDFTEELSKRLNDLAVSYKR